MKKKSLQFLFVIIVLMSFLQSCKSIYCNSYSGIPKQIIPIRQAIEMKNEYQNTIGTLIENNKGEDYKPTQFAYISLDTLKKYIALLDKVQELNKQKISGIRIYFGANPVNSIYPSSHPGRETVFLAPTVNVLSTELSRTHNNLENVPFCIAPKGKDPLVGDFKVITELLHNADNKTSMKYIPKINQKIQSKSTIIEPPLPETSLIIDRLGLTPPPKTTTTQ